MRLLFSLLLLFFLQQARAQGRGDDFVRRIERLRHENKLITKTYPDKTSVGSLTGYYDKGALVLINSLTDAEAAGTETLYYIRNGALSKVFIMAAQFNSHEEWAEYFSKHTALDSCHSCHGKPHCVVTVISFDRDETVTITENGKVRQPAKAEKEEILGGVVTTRKELETLLKEL
jgi:hypothetical protein